MESVDLDELVEAAQTGNEDAFGQLVELTYADAYTLAYRLTGNAEDAADVVQDSYIRAYRNIGKFRGDAKFSTWLYRITANCASTHMDKRRKNRHEHLEHDEDVVDVTTAGNPDFNVQNGSLRSDLIEALEQFARKDACGGCAA